MFGRERIGFTEQIGIGGVDPASALSFVSVPSGRFFDVSGELNHLSRYLLVNPLYFLLKSGRDIKFNHLCHRHPPIHNRATIVIERHRDEMPALVTQLDAGDRAKF
jgi:hypothetical protein